MAGVVGISFLFGLIVGSFLNFFVLRYGTGRLYDKRSRCFSCGKELSVWELFPVVSFVVQKGKCRGCHSAISLQYPVVELLVGVLFTLVAWQFYPDWLMVGVFFVVGFLTMSIAVYDLRHKIIPDGLVMMLGVLSLIYFVVWGEDWWLTAAAALAAAAAFFLLWYFSSGRLMGLGDAKLVLPLVLLLPAGTFFNFVLISFVSGATVGLLVIGIDKFLLRRGGRSFTIKSEMPFAPFLIFGFWVSLLFNELLFSLF